MKYEYDASSEITKEYFLSVISAGVITMICKAIVDAAHFIADYDWLIKQFLPLLDHPDEQVRGVTVTCLGHLARVNEDANKEQLLSILQPLLVNPDVAGRVEDAIDDVNMYLT